MNRNWTELLKSVIPRPCINQRPFVCDGFPDECEVIIIGQNPRNELCVDWWGFWDNSSGFDRLRLSDVYQQKGFDLNTGTRGRLNKIKDRGVQCVETNVYSSEGSCNRSDRIPNQTVLELLLRNMPHLEWVIVHGAIAHDWIKKYRNLIRLPDNRLLKPCHFRNISDDRLNQICRQVEKARYEWIEEGKQLLLYNHITAERAIASRNPELPPMSTQEMLWEQSNAARNWSNRVELRFGARAFAPYPYALHSFKENTTDLDVQDRWSQCKAHLNKSIASLEKYLSELIKTL